MKEVACGLMYNKKGLVLMGLRPYNRPYPAYWEFPGGCKELNETIEECLKREWREELNVEISIEHELFSSNYANIRCHFFVGKITDEDNIKVNVHESIQYLLPKNIYSLHLFPGDKVVIDKLLLYEMNKSIT